MHEGTVGAIDKATSFAPRNTLIWPQFNRGSEAKSKTEVKLSGELGFPDFLKSVHSSILLVFLSRFLFLSKYVRDEGTSGLGNDPVLGTPGGR